MSDPFATLDSAPPTPDAPADGTKTKERILVIADEKNLCSMLTGCLQSFYEVASVPTGEAARSAVARLPFDIAFLDLELGSEAGIDLVPELLGIRPNLCIIAISAHATFETAVDATQRGAQAYLAKPFTPAQVHLLIRQVLERRALLARLNALEDRLAEEIPEVELSSTSPELGALLDALAPAAHSEATILLRGESGTGKGVLAYALHEQSARHQRPFVTINCPTLSEDLLASELFGHAEGAFSEARQGRAGRVETADGGTLFLDEIGELSPSVQAKLLRFLHEKQFERVGENQTRTADVRIVAATKRDLEADVSAGRFRQDLLYRFNVVELLVPPLRERSHDILRLAERFLHFFARKASRPPFTLSPAAAQALLRYPWPGNVRELRNMMEHVAILWPAQTIEQAAFPRRIRGAPVDESPSLGGDYSLEQIDREHILRVAFRAPTAEEAAKILGIDASTLWRKRRRYRQ